MSIDWSRFDRHAEGARDAFEMMCAHLFEIWCRRTYSGQLNGLYFLDGRGGDGGVEAFAWLRSGDVVGLQAKWFADGLKESQQKQLGRSFQAAIRRHPRLRRYIVCLRDDPGDAKKHATEKSELDRWNAFVGEAKQTATDVEVEHWGATAIARELGQPDAESIQAFWFQRTRISTDHWRRSFERHRRAWFSERYLPDLHCSMEVEQELRWHIQDEGARREAATGARRFSAVLRTARQAAESLPRYVDRVPELAGAILTEAGSVAAQLASGEEYAESLAESLERGGFPLAALEEPACLRGALPEIWGILGALHDFDRKSTGWGATHGLIAPLEAVHEALRSLRDLRERLNGLRGVLVLEGEAGVGKTHAALEVARQLADEEHPVILLAARSTSPRGLDWAGQLAGLLDLGGWSARDVPAAAEASVHTARRRRGAGNGGPDWHGPARALLVIDGLEESAHAADWAARLVELEDLARAYPRLAIAVTVRSYATSTCLPAPGDWSATHRVLHPAELPIAEIFRRYCERWNVDASRLPWLPDVLRTPIAVRLFAEHYAGQRLEPTTPVARTLAQLVRAKLARLDKELADAGDWPRDGQVALPALGALAEACVRGDGGVTAAAALEIVGGAAPHVGELGIDQRRLFLARAVDFGFLDRLVEPAEDPLDVDDVRYLPAFHQVLDVLLAHRALRVLSHDGAEPSPNGGTLPEVLEGRDAALAILVSLLVQDGVFPVQREMWRGQVDPFALAGWQLRALSELPPERARPMDAWVAGLLVESMPRCRQVLSQLVIPVARWAEHPFNAAWLHEQLVALPVAERDLFWSGPDYIPTNHGGKWEGEGRPVFDEIELRPGDRWDGPPTIVAWATSSVVRARRITARAKLAAWGARSLAELAKLVDAFAAVNDDQVVEEVLVAAAGAALRGRYDDPALVTLAETVDRLFFGDEPAGHRDNCVVRHAARVIVERVAVLGFDLPDGLLAQSRPPYPYDEDALPPLDREAAFDRSKAADILDLDLDAYVSKKPFEGFVEQETERLLRNDTASSRGDGTSDERDLGAAVEPPLDRAKVSDALLGAAADGTLGKFSAAVQSGIMSEIAERERERAAAPRVRFELILPTEEELELRVRSLFDSEDAEDIEQRSTRLVYPAEAEAFVARLSAMAGIERLLSPGEVRRGLVTAFVRGLGWEHATFYGDPRGGKEGEVLGADTAIRRMTHGGRSHGARSPVASFAEKYVWSAVHHLAGYLADRLPRRRDYGGSYEPVDDFSELADGFPDPFEAVDAGSAGDAVPPWSFAGLAPEVDLQAGSQSARAQEWLDVAPWPSVEQWVSRAEGTDELLLNGWFRWTRDDLGVQFYVWMTAFAVPQSGARLLLRDAERVGLAAMPFRDPEHLEGHYGRSYSSPSLASWAPWISDGDPPDEHATLDARGRPTAIRPQRLTAEVMWERDGQETYEDLPAPLLRSALGVLDGRLAGRGRRFVRRDQRVVARSAEYGEPWGGSHHQRFLAADRGLVLDALSAKGLVPLWAVRVTREATPGLVDGLVRQDRRWLVHMAPGARGRPLAILLSENEEE